MAVERAHGGYGTGLVLFRRRAACCKTVHSSQIRSDIIRLELLYQYGGSWHAWMCLSHPYAPWHAACPRSRTASVRPHPSSLRVQTPGSRWPTCLDHGLDQVGAREPQTPGSHGSRAPRGPQGLENHSFHILSCCKVAPPTLPSPPGSCPTGRSRAPYRHRV